MSGEEKQDLDQRVIEAIARRRGLENQLVEAQAKDSPQGETDELKNKLSEALAEEHTLKREADAGGEHL